MNMSPGVSEITASQKMHLDGVRRAIVTPNVVPMDAREKTARLLVELLQDDASSIKIDGYNVVSEIVSKLKIIGDWQYLRSEAKENDVVFAVIFDEMFSMMLNAMNDGNSQNIPDEMLQIRSRIEGYAEVMDVLESIYPGSNFDDSSETIYEMLFSDPEKTKDILRKKEILKWMSEIMRHSEYELMSTDKDQKHVSKRPVVILADTSKSMFGEPEVIAKAVMLAITKRMLSQKRDVDIMFINSDGKVTLNLDSEKEIEGDFMKLISYSFGNDDGFTSMITAALDAMKQGFWKDKDVIMISKGEGVVNGMTLAREWETYKAFNNVRTVSIAAACESVKGLTELSDQVFVMNDRTIMKSEGQYAKLIQYLGN